MHRLLAEIAAYLSLAFTGMLAVLLAHGFYTVAHVYGPVATIILGVLTLAVFLALFITPPVGLALRLLQERHPHSTAANVVRRVREGLVHLLH